MQIVRGEIDISPFFNYPNTRLEINPNRHLSQIDHVAVVQLVGLMRRERLAVEIGAIGAAQIGNTEAVIHPKNAGVSAGYAFAEGMKGREVNVGYAGRVGTGASDHDTILIFDDNALVMILQFERNFIAWNGTGIGEANRAAIIKIQSRAHFARGEADIGAEGLSTTLADQLTITIYVSTPWTCLHNSSLNYR